MSVSVSTTAGTSVSVSVSGGTTTSFTTSTSTISVTSDTPSQVSVTNKGPKGDKGETGATGATGPQGPAGSDGTSPNAFTTISVAGQDNVVADGVDDTLTIAGGSNVTVTTNASTDTITIASTDTNTQLSTEEVQDIVGAMFTGNTETRIAATYEDSDGTIDLVVDDMTGTEVANDSSPQLGGDLDVNGNSIVSASGGNITIDPDGTGAIILRSDDIRFDGTGGVTTGQVKLYETSILSPQHFIAIQAPLSVTADTTLTLPDGAGSSGQVLSTNGSGTLSWLTVPTSNNPDFFGILELKTVGGTQGEFIIYDNDNSHYISIKAPTVVSSNVDFILPDADGSANQVLKTDGSGNLSFDTVGDVIDNRKFTKTSNTDGDSNGDVVYIGGTTSMTTGALYHYKSDGTWELADADSAATCDGLLGIALGAASDTNGVLLRGMVTIDHDPGAVGDVLFVSTTAGDITATAPSGNGDIVRVVGYCLDASNGQIWFNPDGAFVEVSA